jgi:hypothetical protein
VRYFTGCVTQQRVPASFLKELCIPVPDAKQQKHIVDCVKASRLMVEQKMAVFESLKSKVIFDIETQILSGKLINP